AVPGAEWGRLGPWEGRPVLAFLHHPPSHPPPELLRFAQDVHARHGKAVTVVGLSVSDDTAAALNQREALRLGFPIYSGGGMRISYGVETTPKLVVIDPRGAIRGAYLGWRSAEHTSELQH